MTNSKRPRRVHIVGIGGIGLSAIAKILLAQGEEVSGSDLKSSPVTDDLETRGAKIFIGQHLAENVGDVDLVLITSAAHADNAEVLEAKRRGIRIVRRYDFFPELTQGKKVIAVSGTHGKTTTTGMIGSILVHAGLEPSVIVGGMIQEFGGNALQGSGDYFVIEADEYDRAFLGLRPSIAVVTAIELDHPDIFKNVAQVEDAFHQFLDLVQGDGLIVGCGDSESVESQLGHVRCQVVRFGFSARNDYRALHLKPNEGGGMDFQVSNNDEITNISLGIPGKHNVLNSLAAVAVADRVGVDRETTLRVLRYFVGADRRFEVKGEFGGVAVVDDYAHHPTEIRATLAAARERYAGRAIWAVFQPHTYSRTKALLDEFAAAFDDADHVVVTEIFAAREKNQLGITSQGLLDRMSHRDARFIETLDEAADYLVGNLKSSDVLITLGAGDVNRVGEQVAAKLAARSR